MFIKKIVLRNFQSHSHTTIELSPKINIFLGKGNRGKSAIIRALKWVFFNEPQGTGFIKKGETFASCSVTFDNDYTIIRERGDKINRYILISPDNQRIEYSNFGREIPLDIKKILRIETLPIENGLKLSPQIKDQMESVYLIDETPSTLHSTLLTISGGQTVDEAIKSLSLDLDRLNRREKELKKEIEEKESNLKNYEGVDQKKDEMLKIKDEIVVLKKLEDKKNKLIKIKNNYNELKKENEEINIYYSKLKNIDEIDYESMDLIDKKLKYLKLKSISEELINNQKELQKNYNELKLYKDNEINYERIEEILSLKEKFIKFKNIYFQYQKIKNEIEIEEKEKKKIEDNINELINGYVNLIVKNGVCPVCYREIDEKIEKDIENNIKKMWR
ncbi:MAG: AAA family ATPase [Caldisericia bacterium]